MNTPVVLIIFNRPDTTAEVFQAIRQARPPKLLVIADGPRGDRPGEAERCQQTRAIIQQVDWDCQVLTNYADQNLGCQQRISGGLDWVFEQVEDAIILEDDCVPSPDFFAYCETLLERYRHDERIMTICGTNPRIRPHQPQYSYFFSRYMFGWGWASWRRAWTHYDVEMALWPQALADRLLEEILEQPRAIAYWQQIFQQTYDGQHDAWDYRWLFATWMQSGLAILPTVNLVTNVGFRADATHTTSQSDDFSRMPSESLALPLCHPPYLIRDRQTDDRIQEFFFSRGFMTRAKSKLRRLRQGFRQRHQSAV